MWDVIYYISNILMCGQHGANKLQVICIYTCWCSFHFVKKTRVDPDNDLIDELSLQKHREGGK